MTFSVTSRQAGLTEGPTPDWNTRLWSSASRHGQQCPSVASHGAQCPSVASHGAPRRTALRGGPDLP